MLSDLRHAFRSLRKTPGLTATVLATLAVCLGANLTIFAVVDAILIRALPYPRPDQLLTLYYTYPKLAGANNGASLTSYYERRGKIPALASLAAIAQATSVVGEPGATAIENLGRVTPEFFATLGVKPLLGRAFTDAEMTYQTDQVAILGYDYWRSQFDADPGVIGRSIRMDGIKRVIVGVLPPDFRFLSFSAPLYMPLSSEEGERNVGARHSLNNIQIARLADGATLADAQAQIAAHDAAHAAEFPDAKIVADSGWHTVVAPLQADYVASVRPTLLLLQVGAVCLLLIGGVNLVNLLLIRASGRARELAVRQALGASQRHLVRDVLTETILLTVLGAGLGLGVGAIGVKLLAAFGTDQLPVATPIAFNVRLAVVALLGALGLGLAIGAPVVWFNLRRRLSAVLQSESRSGTASRATQRLRHGFVVAQIALAFVLLTGAGLLGLSLQRAMSVAPGFRPDHVITGQFSLTWSGYHTDRSFQGFFDRLYEKTRALPGVTAIGAASNIPVVGGKDADVLSVPGHVAKPGEALAVHDTLCVAGDYFAAMGIPLRAGRYLEQADASRAELYCVVDEAFARHYWPEGGALGKQLYLGTANTPQKKPCTVVGVVGTVKQFGLTDARARGAVYFTISGYFARNFFLVARTSLPPEALGATLAKILREVDPDMPLTDLRSMDVRIADSLATRRSPALLAGIFAGAALLLSTIGLYGVMAYAVGQRTNEFGLRLALGAQRGDVLRLVFGEGLRLTGLGLAAGLLAALLLTGSLTSLLFAVKPNDPLALLGIGALLASVAALACYLPARRAMQVDPMVALRAE